MLEQGLVALITADAGLLALIGDRFYPVQLPPENTVWPCLTYQATGAGPEYTIDRKQTGFKRIQFDAFGTSYAQCRTVLNALRNALDLYTGTLSDGTRVLSALRSVEIDSFEDDARVYRSLCEYTIRFVEP